MTFGDKLKKLRKEHKFSQSELADKIDMSQQSIAFLETNKRKPSQKTLKKLSDFFNVPINYFLDYYDNIPNDSTFILHQEKYNNFMEFINSSFDELQSNPEYVSKLFFEYALHEYLMSLNSIIHYFLKDKSVYLEQNTIHENYLNSLIYWFGKLNDNGKRELIKRLEELTRLDEYKNSDD